jgi:hypothetical protein
MLILNISGCKDNGKFANIKIFRRFFKNKLGL